MGDRQDNQEPMRQFLGLYAKVVQRPLNLAELEADDVYAFQAFERAQRAGDEELRELALRLQAQRQALMESRAASTRLAATYKMPILARQQPAPDPAPGPAHRPAHGPEMDDASYEAIIAAAVEVTITGTFRTIDKPARWDAGAPAGEAGAVALPADGEAGAAAPPADAVPAAESAFSAAAEAAISGLHNTIAVPPGWDDAAARPAGADAPEAGGAAASEAGGTASSESPFSVAAEAAISGLHNTISAPPGWDEPAAPAGTGAAMPAAAGRDAPVDAIATTAEVDFLAARAPDITVSAHEAAAAMATDEIAAEIARAAEGDAPGGPASAQPVDPAGAREAEPATAEAGGHGSTGEFSQAAGWASPESAEQASSQASAETAGWAGSQASAEAAGQASSLAGAQAAGDSAEAATVQSAGQAAAQAAEAAPPADAAGTAPQVERRSGAARLNPAQLAMATSLMRLYREHFRVPLDVGRFILDDAYGRAIIAEARTAASPALVALAGRYLDENNLPHSHRRYTGLALRV